MQAQGSYAQEWSFVSVFPEDRGPLPMVTEDDSEEAWREYDLCTAALDSRLRELRVTLSRMPPRSHERLRDIEARFTAELALEVGVDDVMSIARRNGRVCPNPGPWRLMYRLLPSAPRGVRLLRAPYPIELREWSESTDVHKQQRLREQLDWAHVHGALPRVRNFLSGLREDEWFHSEPASWPAL